MSNIVMSNTVKSFAFRLSLCAAALLGGGAVAFAQAPARTLFGHADFEMDWQLEPQNKTLRVRYSAAVRRLRIEVLDGSEQVMLRDLARGDVVILIAQGQKGAFAQKAPPLGPFQPQEVGETRQIAGQTCRDFVMQGQKLCVSDDGIPLAIEFGTTRILARNLIRQTQHPALFLVPKELKLQPLPGAAANTVPKLPF
jgi:hypothetical protein